jgi:predicted glutamine amidotransferase
VSLGHEEDQHVALLASVPLTSEPWEALREGEVVVLRGGRLVRRHASSDAAAASASP